MKLIDFLEKQVQKWNTENKCGQCYEFYAPLTEEALNKQQLKNCCVSIMLTMDRGQVFGVDRIYNTQTGTKSDEWEFKNFALYFVVPQGININNHTEILGHSTELSKSKTLEYLQGCIIDFDLDFCEFLGAEWQLMPWSAQQLLNYRDNNYTGYRISISIRKRKIK